LVAIISLLNAAGNSSTPGNAGLDTSVRMKSDRTAKIVAAVGRIDKLRSAERTDTQ